MGGQDLLHGTFPTQGSNPCLLLRSPAWAGGFFLFLFVVNFVIHWNETAMGLHVFPIPIPPPTSLSTQSLWVFPVHQVRAPPGKPLCFIMNSSHSQFYSLFYYLSDTYGDCPRLGGFCHSAAWTAKKVPWSMCVRRECAPLPLTAAWAHQWVTWPPRLLLPPRPWASMREAAAVGGFDELHGLCVSSVLWSHPLWWVCLSQKFHFWELKALNTSPSSPLLGVDLNIQLGSDF